MTVRIRPFAAVPAAALALALSLPAALALAGEGQGQFQGQSNHVTTGGVSLVQTASGWEIHLADDFTFDGAPDPRIAFGRDGRYAEGTDFAELRSDTGAQIYAVPEGIDPAAFDTIVLWCRQFSVPLGYAGIE